MTVNELIEQLKGYPGDMMVVIPGYEGGYDNPEVQTGARIILDTNWDGKNKVSWYMGRHDQYFAVDHAEENTIKAIVVGRGK